MDKIIEELSKHPELVAIGVLTSIVATVIVLLTQYGYREVSNWLPANKLFNSIKNSTEECIIHQVRLKDIKEEGVFYMPIPNFSSFPKGQPKYELKQLIPWVLSAEDSNASAMVLNVLGQVGRTDNVRLSYVDEGFDEWEHPMFLIGGSLKAHRVFEKFKPEYNYSDGAFVQKSDGKEFRQKEGNDDLGLLLKTYNSTTKKPIWIVMGMRGAGTAGAAHALTKWWKLLGKLYGKKEFGLIVQFSDLDGWRDSTPISFSPKPSQLKIILHPFAYYKLKGLLKEY